MSIHTHVQIMLSMTRAGKKLGQGRQLSETRTFEWDRGS